MNREQLQAVAEQAFPGDEYEQPSERAFALLVAVAEHTYQLYLEEDEPSLDDPASFEPQTLANVSHGWALLQGLRENLEIAFPDAMWDLPERGLR